ncbi:hypothetical protein [Pedobacter sp. Hv1]|uniref:hypothetical protein n=1 Tax=Pedobacter sp. Hv1 TaxID=1740090 RepID=UPI0006D8A0F0|nr:hypothetical protein [Pedobacter sp. Hv1]KQC02801.1 hypothetical protein AQF98_04295 [Pedobacter sp. Hv1]
MYNFLPIDNYFRKDDKLSFFPKLFLSFCFILILNNSFATNVPPKSSTTWGCKIGQKVYWNWLGTFNVSGGVTYYHFNPSGEYTQWDDDYALRPEYKCYRFQNISGPTHSCSVNGVIGIRGNIDSSPVYCSIDSNLAMLLMAVGVYLIYAIRINRNYRSVFINSVLSA